ncbi:MAG: RluA family pseudouridine synthase [Lachnospiraceae bacterium]|nr:RluA family pseudouridine synthase [Lachnospiraceae bacterium]MBR4608261.1 RluA family pseudouridine synthase [Lachnospiraceae bacterium]
MERIELVIPVEYEDVRLDKSVSELMGEKLSRSSIQKMIKNGELTVNGKTEKTSYQVKTDDVIAFTLKDPVELDLKAENIPLSVLYEDDDLLIIDKPKGMVVHPAAGHAEGTLVNALAYYCKGKLSGINGVLRPGIVHRIDKDTSGSLVVCKNDTAHQGLAEQFQVHSITRRYYCICCGNVKEDEGTINKPIGRHPMERKKMCITENGRRAVTHYKVLERFGKYTFLECSLETGRTHQIRVHLASIGHPILGDLVYGKQDYKGMGQILHAGVLGFKHPVTGEWIEVTSELPPYFQELLEKLRRELHK